VAVELLVPEHSGQRLTLNTPALLVGDACMHLGVEAIGLLLPRCDHRVEVGERRRAGAASLEAGADHGTASGGDVEGVQPGHLGSGPRGVYCVCLPVDDILVEGVFEEAGRVSLAEQPPNVGLVVAEDDLTRPLELNVVAAQLSVRYDDAA